MENFWVEMELYFSFLSESVFKRVNFFHFEGFGLRYLNF